MKCVTVHLKCVYGDIRKLLFVLDCFGETLQKFTAVRIWKKVNMHRHFLLASQCDSEIR